MPNAAQILRNARRLLEERGDLLNEERARNSGLRTEIEASWRRSALYGVRSDKFEAPEGASQTEIAPSAEVLRLAAGPVADAVGDDLADTGVTVLVSDDDGLILDLRAPDSEMRGKLDRLGLVPGYRFGEDTVGTTAIAVALSEKGPAFVAGGEHYADALTGLVCAAAPVVDRRGGRVVGTVALASEVEAASPLMVALVNRAAHDVERLLSAAATGRLRDPDEIVGWDSLTATERDVAAIVAEGATNREAAALMYLSRHTIDAHLRQIFRKLGIASRVELTRHVLGRGGASMSADD